MNKDFSEIYEEKSQNFTKSEILSSRVNTKTDGNLISDLVSELFNHIDSKESFDFISDLEIASLNIYKKTYSVENGLIIPENVSRETMETKVDDPLSIISSAKADYLAISNDIQSILSNCPDLSTSQKLDYCNSQRYFMKLYLRNIVTKLKNQ